MRNAVTVKYLLDLEAEIKNVKETILRGVGTYDEYKSLTGKLMGLQTAENIFNETMALMEKIDE